LSWKCIHILKNHQWFCLHFWIGVMQWSECPSRGFNLIRNHRFCCGRKQPLYEFRRFCKHQMPTCFSRYISILSLFSLFWKKKGGLWDHYCLSVCLCILFHYIALHSLNPKLVKMTVGCRIYHKYKNILLYVHPLLGNWLVNKFPRSEIFGKQSVARFRNNRMNAYGSLLGNSQGANGLAR
jgi:hypothetical protein